MSNSMQSLVVLIVDDEPLLRSCLRFEVEMLGCTVLEAGSGREAQSLLGTQVVSLILSDIRMPNGDGIELLKYVRQHHLDVPLFLMSGFIDIPLWDVYDYGAEAFIAKPFEVDELERRVRKILRSLLQSWEEGGDQTANEADSEKISLIKSSQYNLGRGGAFLKIDGLDLKRDTVVSFETEVEGHPDMKLEGKGIMRWVRRNSEPTLPAGCGIEFLTLSPKTAQWVSERLSVSNPLAFIPRA